MVLRPLPALLQEVRELRPRRRRLPGRQRSVVRHRSQGRAASRPGVPRGRPASRLSLQQGHQRLPARRVRDHRSHHSQRRAVEHRSRVPAPGDAARQPRCRHRGPDPAHLVRRQARDRGGVHARRTNPAGNRGSRGDLVRRHDQLAAASAPVRDRGCHPPR